MTLPFRSEVELAAGGAHGAAPGGAGGDPRSAQAGGATLPPGMAVVFNWKLMGKSGGSTVVHWG